MAWSQCDERFFLTLVLLRKCSGRWKWFTVPGVFRKHAGPGHRDRTRLQIPFHSSEIMSWTVPFYWKYYEFWDGTHPYLSLEQVEIIFHLFISRDKVSALFIMAETPELTIIQSNYCSLTVKVPCYSFHKYPGWYEPSSVQSLFFFQLCGFSLANL